MALDGCHPTFKSVTIYICTYFCCLSLNLRGATAFRDCLWPNVEDDFTDIVRALQIAPTPIGFESCLEHLKVASGKQTSGVSCSCRTVENKAKFLRDGSLGMPNINPKICISELECVKIICRQLRVNSLADFVVRISEDVMKLNEDELQTTEDS